MGCPGGLHDEKVMISTLKKSTVLLRIGSNIVSRKFTIRHFKNPKYLSRMRLDNLLHKDDIEWVFQGDKHNLIKTLGVENLRMCVIKGN